MKSDPPKGNTGCWLGYLKISGIVVLLNGFVTILMMAITLGFMVRKQGVVH